MPTVGGNTLKETLSFNEQTKQYEREVLEPETAEMEQKKLLGGLTRFDVMGLPVGEVAVGTGVAVLFDRVIIARLDPQQKWGMFANLAAAWALKNYGARFIGSGAASAGSFILVYEALADTVQGWMNRVIPTSITASQSGGSFAQPRGDYHQVGVTESSLGRYVGAL